VVALSGRYDLTTPIEHFQDLFDRFYNDDIYFNTPTHFLPNLTCEWQLGQLRALHIVLVIGEHDPFRDSNECLSHILHRKGIAHEFHVWSGRAHQGHDWRRMVRLYV
jgi:esterase/lipase superfamily enzyme